MWAPATVPPDKASPGSNRQLLSLCRRRCTRCAHRPCLEEREGSLGADPVRTRPGAWHAPSHSSACGCTTGSSAEGRRSPAGPWTCRFHLSLQRPPQRPMGAPECCTHPEVGQHRAQAPSKAAQCQLPRATGSQGRPGEGAGGCEALGPAGPSQQGPREAARCLWGAESGDSVMGARALRAGGACG